MTIQALADMIHKGKSAVSKYENGQIIIDIVTLYDIAEVLGVHAEQLMYSKPPAKFTITSAKVPAFFRNLTQFYMFFFDGRNNTLNRSVIDVYSNEKWGLFTGISSRPLMPVALKALFTKIPLKETRELLQRLTISKDDIRLIKIYNMLTVTGHGDF